MGLGVVFPFGFQHTKILFPTRSPSFEMTHFKALCAFCDEVETVATLRTTL